MTGGSNGISRIFEAVRFALPYHAQVAVVSEGRSELLDLEGRQTWEFPGETAQKFATHGRPLVSALEELHAHGAQFLLVPSSGKSLLEERRGLKQHLHECRVVLDEPEVCTIFALDDFGIDSYQAPDGLPLPPPEMMALTTGGYDPESFYQSGLEVAENAKTVLGRNDLSMDSFRSILDFGCGCARVLRHWKDVDGEVRGADYNPYMVDWCRGNLAFAKSFERTHAGRRLSYEDDTFDFIFAFSVFTHLDQEAHDFWLDELRRILSPQGILLVTVHGSEYADRVGPDDRASYEAGELLIKNAAFSGSSSCAVYHPERYIRERLPEKFDLTLVDLAPGMMRIQDGVVLQKS
jgi:SAM-dependent methyltransferase